MKKILFVMIFLLGLSSINAQSLMVVNNTMATSMNGSIRLHNKMGDPNPELGDIPLAVPAYGQIWINNGSTTIPFSALNNAGMSFYTPTLGANFSPGMGTSYSQTVLQWNACCADEYKWSCIKTDIGGYFDIDPTLNGYPNGYIQIAPPYNATMGAAVATSWGYRALSAAPHEVFAVNNFEYNTSFSIVGGGFLDFINGTSPFGGYMIVVNN